MRKIFRPATLVAGLVVAAGMVTTSCSDDSTATAPITGDEITTTSMYSSSTSEDSDESEEAEADADRPDDSTEATGDDDSQRDDTPGSDLPDTEPNESTPVPDDFPGPDGAPLSDKAKRYLSALDKQNVTFMGDSDNLVAITMAEYICSERKKGTDPHFVKAYVTASVGPGTESVGEANAKADKVIKAAEDHYC